MNSTRLNYIKLNIIILLFSIFLSASCATLTGNSDLQNLNDRTNEVTTVMKGYQPIDPIQLQIVKESEPIGFREIIDQFPNEASRIAIGRLGRSGSIVFGPFNVARKGESYSVIIDYIKYITTSIPAKYAERHEIVKVEAAPVSLVDKGVYVIENYSLQTNHGTVDGSSTEMSRDYSTKTKKDYQNKVSIPVYVGIGLRIQATVTTLQDSVNLGSLYGLGIAASQNKISGTLIIQSLGISGESISPLIPIPDRINESTIQAAMQALSTIKSKIYDVKTVLTPQVVAFQLPFNVDGAKDLIESTLHTEPPTMTISNERLIDFSAIELRQ